MCIFAQKNIFNRKKTIVKNRQKIIKILTILLRVRFLIN